jgi:hypothetical protein
MSKFIGSPTTTFPGATEPPERSATGLDFALPQLHKQYPVERTIRQFLRTVAPPRTIEPDFS